MIDLNQQRIVNRSLSGSEGATVLEVAKWLALSGILVALLLTSASIRDQILGLQYDIVELKRSNERLAEQNDMLKVEYRSLTTPARIAEKAEEIGLISSNRKGVVILESRSSESGDPKLLAQTRRNATVVHE